MRYREQVVYSLTVSAATNALRLQRYCQLTAPIQSENQAAGSFSAEGPHAAQF
jgi:hypothetical protein